MNLSSLGGFNDARDTFYNRLYGVEHMKKDRSDRERKHTATTLRANLFDYHVGKIIIVSHRQDNTNHGLWLERELTQYFHHGE